MNYTDEQKRTALMLCIFGGWLGLHRFYLKKYVSGTIYLLTMGGFFVGWFIDIYQIATGKMFNDIEIKENSKDLNYYGGKKELKHLYSILRDGEQVLYTTTGQMDANIWMVACTNQRVLFIDKGMLYGVKQHEILLKNITSVSYKTGMINGDIFIYSYGTMSEIRNVPKITAAKFVDVVNEAITRL